MTIILGFNNTDRAHLVHSHTIEDTFQRHRPPPLTNRAIVSYSCSLDGKGKQQANIMQDSTLSAAVPIPPVALNGLDQAQFEADKRAVYK